MGNVSGREQKSKESNQDEFFMECGHGHGQAQVNSSNSYPAHMLQPQIQRGEFNPENNISIPTEIGWFHGGKQVAIEGSWDNWRTRELLEGCGTHFSIFKVLNAGVYHYRFIVDGQWTYATDLPHERDDFGNIYNILDLQDYYHENVEKYQEPESPSSPISSYTNAPFTFEDFSQKLPEMPPLLQHMPLNQPTSSKNCQRALQKPLSSNLEHLYIKRDERQEPVIALSSSQRFRSKFVTTVLYKPFKKVSK
ncbi:hypothetical protein L2E82_37309 [Cichorium intybus]|uniref:Uncharacterized protein n=1 Tax=Cichorium intybus TaxID=13427 RepID=A0ACB9ADG3_CICIN|nr:hypothetical protein L2E82_37309 [Cichorium intybus]